MTEAYPLQWPAGWQRTQSGDHQSGFQFKKRDASKAYGSRAITFAEARDELYDEQQRLGASKPIVSTNHPTDRYGIPVESKRKLEDDGIAVYFSLNGKDMVMACDRFLTAAANMRSLGLAIEALRQLERHGGGTMMEKAFTGFVALPAPKNPYDILGIKGPCDEAGINAAYRQKVKEVKSQDELADLNVARDKILKGSA